MAGAYTLYVHVQAGVTGLVNGLRTAGGRVLAFGGQVRTLNDDLNQLAARSEGTRRGLATGFAVAGAALGGAFAIGVQNAIELEKRMANVMTISKEINNTNIQAFTDQIVELSTQLPQTADQLAEGLYQVVSTGFDGADAMTILKVAARGAAAGLTTTETSARALLGVLKAYGMGAGEASDVMDVMFQTVNYGVVSFDELAQQLGDVIPMAAAAGVEFDEVSAAVAAVTLAGIPAAESVTALNMLMTRMMKPTRELRDLMTDLGYESAASALEQDGLYVVMEKVRSATGGTADQLVPLLKDVRAVRAALALSAADGQNYADVYQGIAMEIERAGATQKAYAIQLDTASGQWALFRNQATALGIDMARVLLPVLQTIGEYMNILAGAINGLPGPVKSLAGVLLALSAAALLAKAAFLRFGAQITLFRSQVAAARVGGSVLPAVLTGTGIAVAGLTTLLALGVGAYAAYSASKQKAKAATEELVEALRTEREEGEQGAGLRKLTEQLTSGEDVKKLKDAGVDVATALDAITSGGKKLRRLKQELDWAESGTWEVKGGVYLYDVSYRRAKKVLDKQHKIWSDAVKKESELARNMAIVNSKIKTNRQELAGAWDLTQSLPTDKNGAPQFTEEMEAMGKALGSIVDPAKAWKAAQDKVADANREAGRSADASKAKLSDYVSELRKQLQAQREFQKNLGLLAAEGRLDLADHFSELGPDSAPILAELVEQLKSGKSKVADELADIIRESSARATPAFRAGLEQLPAIAAKYGQKVARAWADASATNDPRKLGDVMQRMAIADMSKAAKRLPAEAEAQLDKGMRVLADVAAKHGKEASTALAHAFLKGDAESIRTQLAYIYGADLPIKAPDLNGVIAAFRQAGKKSNAEWSGMLSLITIVAKKKGAAAANALTRALLSGDMAAVQQQLNEIGVAVGRIPGNKSINVNVNAPARIDIPVVLTPKGVEARRKGSPFGPYKGGYRFKADGGLLSFYGNGGVREKHIAEIAPAGAWRVWSEPETHGEAYIPLAESKRVRSKQILAEVARRFGGQVTYHADGGLTGFKYQPPQLYTLSGIASDAQDKNGRFSLALFSKKLDSSVGTARRWRKDLSTVARRAGQDVASALADMGDDGVALTRRMATGSSRYVRSMAKELRDLAAASKASLGDYTGQLRQAVKDQTGFEQNLAKLAAGGYGDLAKRLAEQGDQDAADLAAQAVKDKKKAKAANDAARSAGKTVPNDALTDLVAIIAAVKSKTTGLHAVADATKLDEDHIIEIANLGLARMKKALGAKGAKFFSDLSRANKGLSYANGGILTPGVYAASGGLIKFAEPETQGEAFIPLGAAKRSSAIAVLNDVAARFGMRLSNGALAPAMRLVDARPPMAIKVTVVQQQPKALVENMPITVQGRDTSPQELSGEIMRRLRNAQRGGRL